MLYFASSFFQAALCGGWAETDTSSRPRSTSSVVTISQPSSAGSGAGQPAAEAVPESHMTFAPIDPDMDPDEVDLALDFDLGGHTSGSEAGQSSAEREKEDRQKAKAKTKALARENGLKKLESAPTAVVQFATGTSNEPVDEQKQGADTSTRRLRRSKSSGKRPDAIIVLKEEKVCASRLSA